MVGPIHSHQPVEGSRNIENISSSSVLIDSKDTKILASGSELKIETGKTLVEGSITKLTGSQVPLNPEITARFAQALAHLMSQ